MSAPTRRTSRRVNAAASSGVRGVVLAAADHRTLELARDAPSRRLAQGPRHRRPDRRRHPRADRAHPRERHAERGHRPRSRRRFRPRGAEGAGRRPALHGRARPRAAGDRAPSASTGTRRPGNSAGATATRTSAKHHVVAIDYGVKRNILRLLAERRLRGHGRAGDRQRRGHAGAQARRRVPLQRPRRPGGDRRICRAGDPDAARREGADLRHLPRPPDARPRASAGAPSRCTRAITARTIR